MDAGMRTEPGGGDGGEEVANGRKRTGAWKSEEISLEDNLFRGADRD